MPAHESTLLREQRATAYERMKEINDAAEAESRDLTAEEAQEYDRVEADFDSLGKRIDRIEKHERISPLIRQRPDADQEPEKDEERAKPAGSYQEYLERRAGAAPQDAPEYREQFYRWLATGEQPTAVAPELRVQSKATAGAGANLVPTSFEDRIIATEREFGVMEQLSDVMTTDTGENIQIPSVTAHGTAAWTAENAAFTASDETFGQVTVGAYKAATIVLVSEELLQDNAFDLETYLTDELGIRIGILKNTGFVVGDGSGKPTGITNAVVAGKTGQTGQTTTVTTDDLFDVFHSIKVPYRRNAAWVCNDASIKVIRKLKDTTNQYLWQPGLVAGQPDQLLGKPIYADPDMPVMAANAKSIVFGDFRRAYKIRNVRGIALQRLVERYAELGQVAFRAYQRTDGKQVNSEAVKSYVNSAT